MKKFGSNLLLLLIAAGLLAGTRAFGEEAKTTKKNGVSQDSVDVWLDSSEMQTAYKASGVITTKIPMCNKALAAHTEATTRTKPLGEALHATRRKFNDERLIRFEVVPQV